MTVKPVNTEADWEEVFARKVKTLKKYWSVFARKVKKCKRNAMISSEIRNSNDQWHTVVFEFHQYH